MSTKPAVHYKELIDTNVIGQWDFQRDPQTGNRKRYTMPIVAVERYKPPRQRMKKDPNTGRMVPEPSKRILIRFEGARKPWLAGPVSQDAIAKLFGPNVNDWIGRKLTLYVDEGVTFGRRTTGGVRCEPVAGDRPAQEMPVEDVDEEIAQNIADAFTEAGFVPGEETDK